MDSSGSEFYLFKGHSATEQEMQCSEHVLPSSRITSWQVCKSSQRREGFKFGHLMWKLASLLVKAIQLKPSNILHYAVPSTHLRFLFPTPYVPHLLGPDLMELSTSLNVGKASLSFPPVIRCLRIVCNAGAHRAGIRTRLLAFLLRARGSHYAAGLLCVGT